MTREQIEADIRWLKAELHNQKGAGRMRPDGQWALPRVRARVQRELRKKEEELEELRE